MFYGYPFFGKGFGKPFFGWPASLAGGQSYAVPSTTVITSPYPI